MTRLPRSTAGEGDGEELGEGGGVVAGRGGALDRAAGGPEDRSSSTNSRTIKAPSRTTARPTARTAVGKGRGDRSLRVPGPPPGSLTTSPRYGGSLTLPSALGFVLRRP